MCPNVLAVVDKNREKRKKRKIEKCVVSITISIRLIWGGRGREGAVRRAGNVGVGLERRTQIGSQAICAPPRVLCTHWMDVCSVLTLSYFSL